MKKLLTRHLLVPLSLTISVITVLLTAGCENDSAPPAEIICTTQQVYDLVKNVAGDDITVDVLLTGEGVDPHTWLPTQKDIAKVASAKLVFYSGHHLEGKFDSVFKKMAADLTTVAVAESLPEDSLIKTADGAIDPHVWHDPELWAQTADAVVTALSKHDPDHAADYKSRAAAWQDSVRELASSSRKQLASIPNSQRVLVTSHDAFSYFGRAYEIEVKAIQGISTEAEPSPADIEEMVTFLVENRIPAVFVEKSVNQKTIEAVIAGAKQQGHTVVKAKPLYSDSMGKMGTKEGTYAGMFRANVSTIAGALGPKSAGDTSP